MQAHSSSMSFDVHPILDPGHLPRRNTWYAVAPEGKNSGPCPRVGACASFFQSDDGVGRVLVSAGATPEGPFSDLYELTLQRSKTEWTDLPSKFPARYEHASFIASSSDADVTEWLYLFAGAKPEGSVNDMWRLNLCSKLWQEVEVSGSIPTPRTFHSSSSMVSSDGGGISLVVFSGGKSGMDPVQDQNTYLFCQKSGTWSKLKTSGSTPSPRQGHVSAVVGHTLYIHGGMAGEEVLADLHCLDLKTLKWSCPRVGGVSPPPLAAHGCAVMGRDVYMFGGLSPVYPGAGDALYCLNTETLTWSEVAVSGAPPPARLDHAMCSIKIPVPSSAPPVDKATPPNRITDKTPKASHSGGSLSESSQTSSASCETITVIDPEDVAGSNFSVTGTKETKEEQVSGKMQGLSVREGGVELKKDLASGKLEGGSCDWVPALFVFGGMDTTGIVHGDAFIFVP